MKAMTLKYDPYDFLNIQEMRSELDPHDMRKIYSYFRSVANKRVKRIESAKLTGASKAYESLGGVVPPLSAIPADKLVYAIRETAVFLSRAGSTVKGIRDVQKRRIKTLQERGYDVDEQNFGVFVQFMEEAKDRLLAEGLSYEKIMELYVAVKNREVHLAHIMDDFLWWAENYPIYGKEIFNYVDYDSPIDLQKLKQKLDTMQEKRKKKKRKK